jgi:hypothetical protein
MAFAMEEYEPLDPMDLGVFRAQAGMFDADFLADLIQQFRLARQDGRMYKTNEG